MASSDKCEKSPKGEHVWGGHHHPAYVHQYKCLLCDAEGHFDFKLSAIVPGKAEKEKAA